MKKILALVLLITVCFTLTSCMSTEESLSLEAQNLQSEIYALNTEISRLKSEKSTLQAEVLDTKIEKGTAKYIVTFNIKQEHFTLDLTQHLKDAMNDISIQIPVDKEYYDNVNVGDVIDDSFRMGSLICAGSFGNWKITVEAKEIK